MRLFTLLLFASLAATSLEAASYVQNDGTIVNPILDVTGVVHSYSGDNLKPLVDARGADLTGANLFIADLSDAVFEFAVLRNADMTDANLTRVNLVFSNITEGQFLSGSSVTGVQLRLSVEKV